MSEDVSRLVTYLPLFAMCCLVFLGTLWKTIRVVHRKPTVYHNVVLLLFYVAINCRLMYTVFNTALFVFGKEKELAAYKSLLSAAEAFFTNIAVYFSLERMLIILQKIVDSNTQESELSGVSCRSSFVRGLTLACWMLLSLELLTQVPIGFCRSDPRLRNQVRAFTAFCTFVFISVVFITFVRVMKVATGVWVPSRERMITAFFLLQMGGEAGYSVYCMLRAYYRKYNSQYDNPVVIGFVYTLNVVVDLLPSVLIVLILSRSDRLAAGRGMSVALSRASSSTSKV